MIKKLQLANYSRLNKEKLNRYDFKQNKGKSTERNLKNEIYNKLRKISDFEQNSGIEQRNGKPKKKNYNKPRNIC